MRHIIRLLFILCVPSLALAGHIELKPEIKNIKTLAIASIYMNRNFYNIESPRSTEGEVSLKDLVKGLKKDKLGIGDETSAEEKELNQIITFGLKAFYEQLGTSLGWELLPADAAIRDQAYAELAKTGAPGTPFGDVLQSLAKADEAKWVIAPGMLAIPISSLLDRAKRVVWVNGKKVDPKADVKEGIAKIAKDLKVDAVAIIQLDMGYRFGKMGTLTVMGKTKAKPSVSYGMVIVTQNGDIALRTKPVSPGGGSRWEGESAGLVVNGKMTLKNDRGENVEVFNQALEKAAVAMKTEIEKRITKLK